VASNRYWLGDSPPEVEHLLNHSEVYAPEAEELLDHIEHLVLRSHACEFGQG
jgi:hypothetical protein